MPSLKWVPQWGSRGHGGWQRAVGSPSPPLPAGHIIVTPVSTSSPDAQKPGRPPSGTGPRSYRVRRVPSCPLPLPGLPSWLPRDCREPRELCGDRLRGRGPSAGPPLGQPPGM